MMSKEMMKIIAFDKESKGYQILVNRDRTPSPSTKPVNRTRKPSSYTDAIYQAC